MPETKCPNLDRNNEGCPCTATDCDNHGTCCQCIRNHVSNGSLPACARDLAKK
jgi:hypothetical protein